MAKPSVLVSRLAPAWLDVAAAAGEVVAWDVRSADAGTISAGAGSVAGAGSAVPGVG